MKTKEDSKSNFKWNTDITFKFQCNQATRKKYKKKKKKMKKEKKKNKNKNKKRKKRRSALTRIRGERRIIVGVRLKDKKKLKNINPVPFLNLLR